MKRKAHVHQLDWESATVEEIQALRGCREVSAYLELFEDPPVSTGTDAKGFTDDVLDSACLSQEERQKLVALRRAAEASANMSEVSPVQTQFKPISAMPCQLLNYVLWP